MKNIKQKYNTKKDANGNETFNEIEILNVPENLTELQIIATEKQIIEIVISQVIYHTLLTRARKALQDGQPLENLDFKTGFIKKERQSTEKTQALKTLKGLSVEQLQKILASLQ